MARYWNSRPQEFVSQFVPENLELQQGYFDNLQANQDAYKLKIDGLNKQTDALVNDIPGAIESKKRLETGLEELRNVNYNDPIQQQEALKKVKEYQYELSPFGQLGARDKKKKEYDAFQKELATRYKDNPMMLSYMDKKLKENNLSPDRAISFDDRGNPINTEIIPPKEFKYKDLNDELSSLLKDEQFDQTAHDLGLSKEEGHAALYSFIHGNTKELKGAKIYNDLKNRVLADNNLVESIKADANYFLGDENKANSILEQALQGVSSAGSFKRVEKNKTLHEDQFELDRAKKAADEEDLKQKEAFETTFSKMGDQSINNLSEVVKAEPSNSILSKIINFVNPNNQAKGILNLAKILVPSISELPQLKSLEKDLTEKSNISEDALNDKLQVITTEMQKQTIKDQNEFRKQYGFNNPIYSQTYDILNLFGKPKDTQSNPDYERAKEVVASKDPNFNSLSKQQQYARVKEEMDKFVENSKTNVVLVPMDQKELNFKNSQLANVTGTPSQKTQQLMNLGLTANGKFVDFYTGKETNLEDITKEAGQLKYMGQLDNDNQFGPGMNYFQTSDGKFYVSPASLNDQKNNYINWNLKQTNNKFSQEYEFPLLFENRRDINKDGTIPDGIPKGKITRDLKSGKLKASLNLFGNEKTEISANNEDELKIGIAKSFYDGFINSGLKPEEALNKLKQLGL